MINLLPDDKKANLKAARTNTLLVRYIFLILAACIGMFLVITGARITLSMTEQSAQEVIKTNSVDSGIYKETRDAVSGAAAALSTTKSVLDSEVRYSQVLKEITARLPSGSILQSATFDESLSGTIVVFAKSTTVGGQVAPNLSGASVFSFVQATGTEPTGGTSDYPVKITLRATVLQGVRS